MSTDTSPTHLTGLLSALEFVGTYLAWLIAFEQWVEPALRKGMAAVIGRPIVWVSAGALKVWGLGISFDEKEEGIVSACGCLIVVCAALAPSLFLAATASSRVDASVAASRYLTTAPAAALFMLRMLLDDSE